MRVREEGGDCVKVFEFVVCYVGGWSSGCDGFRIV